MPLRKVPLPPPFDAHREQLAKQLEQKLHNMLPNKAFVLARDRNKEGTVDRTDEVTYEQPTVCFTVSENRNECMMLTFHKPTPRSRYIVEIDTLKYSDHQQKCSVPGPVLLRWVQSLYPKLVQSVRLTDGSSRSIMGVRVPLTPLRKIAKGVGWYESFGFGARNESEHFAFQESFARFRAAELDATRMLAWQFARPIVLNKRFLEFYGRQVWRDEMTTIAHHFQLIPNHTRVHVADEDNMIEVLGQGSDKALLEFVQRLGVPVDRWTRVVGRPSDVEMQFLNGLESQKSSCRCGKRELVPATLRRMLDKIDESSSAALKDDAKTYLRGLAVFLGLLREAGILMVPAHIVYPSRFRPRKTNVCRDEKLKCSA